MTPVGLLLAAGRGRRLGGTKQLIEVAAGTPLVAAAFDAIAGVCDAMIVVLGHEADAVRAALGDRGFDVVEADADAEMIESIQAGLRAARDAYAGRSVMLQPGDHPGVGVETLRALLEGSESEPDKAIMPSVEGSGGHPVLIPPGLIETIVEWRGDGGLRRLWIEHPEWCVRIAVDDPSAVRDLDLPTDL